MNVFITGGTGKIGEILVDAFLKEGHFVTFTSTSILKAESLVNKYKKDNIDFIICDFCKPDYLDVVKSSLIQSSKEINVLINNARDRNNLKVKENNVDIDNWLNEYRICLVVPYQLSMLFHSLFENSLMSVINISSMYGLVAPNRNLYSDFKNQSSPNYGVTKAALNQLTRELAVRLSPKTRVNSISFGGLLGRETNSFNNKYSEMCPMGRMMNESEVSGPVIFLSSGKSSYINGHNLIVDGGWSIW